MHTSIETPYSAPEIRGFVNIDAEASCYTSAVDMWSLGCLVHWLLTQQLPLSTGELLSYCTRGSVLPSKHLDRHKTSADAYDFIAKLLKPQPANRLTASDSLQHQWPKELSIVNPSISGPDLQLLDIHPQQPSELVEPIDSAPNGELDKLALAAKPVRSHDQGTPAPYHGYAMYNHLDLGPRPSWLFSGGSNEGVPSASPADRPKRWKYKGSINTAVVAEARLVPNEPTAGPEKQPLVHTFLSPVYPGKKSIEATRHSGLNAPIRLKPSPAYYPDMFTLNIIAAYGLYKRSVWSLPDPSAVVSINGQRAHVTSPCKLTLNPTWNRAFDLRITPNDILLVEIFDNVRNEKERGFLGGKMFKIKDIYRDDLRFGIDRMSHLIER